MNYLLMNSVCEFLHDNPFTDMKKLLEKSKTGFVGFVMNDPEAVKKFKKKFSEDVLVEYLGIVAPTSITMTREIYDSLSSPNQLLLTLQFDITLSN